MTTVVAKKVSDTVWQFAYDSQVTAGNRAEDYGLSKVFSNGSYVFGGAGYVRTLNVLETAKFPQITAKDKNTYSWVVNKFVPALQSAFRTAMIMEVQNEQAESNSSILMWVRGEVFAIGHDFSAIPVYDYDVVGSGSNFAFGALDAGASAKKAVKIATKRDVYSGGKVNVINVEVV